MDLNSQEAYDTASHFKTEGCFRHINARSYAVHGTFNVLQVSSGPLIIVIKIGADPCLVTLSSWEILDALQWLDLFKQ